MVIIDFDRTALHIYFVIVFCWMNQVMVILLLISTIGPMLKKRVGLRIKQAGRGSYRGS